MTSTLRFTAAGDINPAVLADMRVAAMRPSLEAIGRFDPVRARDRFLATYVADDTQLLFMGDVLVGFYVLRDMGTHLYLDHLYVAPTHHGMGIGLQVVTRVQSKGRDIRLMALRDSPANGFYQSCGFVAQKEDEFDIHYRWDA